MFFVYTIPSQQQLLLPIVILSTIITEGNCVDQLFSYLICLSKNSSTWIFKCKEGICPSHVFIPCGNDSLVSCNWKGQRVHLLIKAMHQKKVKKNLLLISSAEYSNASTKSNQTLIRFLKVLYRFSITLLKHNGLLTQNSYAVELHTLFHVN